MVALGNFILGLCVVVVAVGVNLLFYWLGTLAIGAAVEDYRLNGVAGVALFGIVGMIALAAAIGISVILIMCAGQLYSAAALAQLS